VSPRALAPAIILAASIAACAVVPAQARQCSPQWLPSEGAPGLDANGAILASTTSDPDGDGPEPELLVVAGSFWGAGDITAIGIAAWDGQSSRALGNATGTEVCGIHALAVYNGDLIAAGGFSTSFGSPANFVARFDVATQSWKPLDGSTNHVVRALAVYGGELIATGFFTTAGGLAANHVARWNGSSWAPFSTALPSTQVALAVHDGQLIAAGNGVFRWTGSGWQQLGPTMSVATLAVHDGALIAGGAFRIVSGGPANHIARWDGLEWQPFGSGMDDAVEALATFEGELIAGGLFDHAGGVLVSGLSRWNGATWLSVGAGGGRTVSSLCVYDGDLILGGTESRASGNFATRVMRWDAPCGARSAPGWTASCSPWRSTRDTSTPAAGSPPRAASQTPEDSCAARARVPRPHGNRSAAGSAATTRS